MEEDRSHSQNSGRVDVETRPSNGVDVVTTTKRDDHQRSVLPSPSPSPALAPAPAPVPASVPGSQEGVDRIDDHQGETSMFAADQGNETQLPPPRTPIVDNSSLLYETTAVDQEDRHPNSMTEEQQVMAHLQDDGESSFVAPISPIPVAAPEGGALDDTYLFDGSSSKRDNRATTGDEDRTIHVPAHQESHHHAETSVAATAGSQDQPASTTPKVDPPLNRTHPALSNHDAHPEPPQQQRHDDDADANTAADDTQVSNTASSLENLLSSPTAAAAARTVSRAISMASHHSASDGKNNRAADDSQADLSSRDNSSLQPPNDVSSAGSSLQQQTSKLDIPKLSIDAGSTPGLALKTNSRPKFLRSRNASQRSSTSSFASNEDGDSDTAAGMGADYALQSGGAVPAYGLNRSVSNSLTRSISIGSMASGLDDYPEPGRIPPLEPLEEVVNPASTGEDEEAVKTPRAKTQGSLLPPTDTVIARHVRKVEVPESIANKYMTKGALTTTPLQAHRRVSDYTAPAPGTVARNGRSMTLKEQSSTIERLSKENFDLKLKVMFLSDRLDKLSEEGIKEMISENVELKTSLAVIQRDNKVLRRRVKELEKSLRDRGGEDRPTTAKSGYSSDGGTMPTFDEQAREREEELLYLRERVEEYVTEVERLRNENMSREAEKWKLAEALKTMGDRAGERLGDNLGRQEEADVWKDLLEQETARREQADDENRKLRDEIFRLKQGFNCSSSSIGPGGGGLHHTTNIYNITRKARPSSPSRSRPVSGLSGDADQGSMSQSSTLIDELRRESEQLRHENAELRREVGAQTSMLTSRNREKERLYQEIEELKLAQRRGGPAPSTIDSLLDRSASRAGNNDRSASRASGGTTLGMAVEEDPDHEELENKLAEQRDKYNELKLKHQDVQRELDACVQDYEAAMQAKQQAEDQIAGLEEELDDAANNALILQTERDEALQEYESLEQQFEDLRREAQEEIDILEAEGDQKDEEIHRLQLELQDRTENFEALQEEMRQMSEALVGLEDEQEKKAERIRQLEDDLTEANKELEDLEAKLLESNDKGQRLSVQQESLQDEIAFLREEQEGDKVRIGNLEADLAAVEQSLREEQEHVKELERRIADERTQREIVASREKEEVQQFVDELNREASTAKDEVRRLRKSLTSREVEATEWKERLMEFENNLREALGDLNGTRSSFLKGIANLQRNLDETVRELDATKASVLEKDRIIKQRDALLESHGLESRKLADMLDKERQAHRNTKNQFDTFQRTHSHVSRTVTSQDSRIQELEISRAADKKKMAHLESQFKEQLIERNNLLLVLWTRLSTLCGSDWAHNNSLINGRALPSLESLSTMLPGFSKNLLAAVKTIETLIGGFQGRIKSVERELWKEYHALESTLESRTKKVDRLEALVRSGVTAGNFDMHAKYTQLEAAYRTLKVENATLQRAHDARTRGAGYFDPPVIHRSGSREEVDGSPSPHVPTGPSRLPRSKTTQSHLEPIAAAMPSRPGSKRASSMASVTRRSSSNTRATGAEHGASEARGSSASDDGRGGDAANDGDTRWLFRLRELENKLKQEREARNMDRAAARQRIMDSERQNSELASELARAKRKAGTENGE
ncbi:hypothetical protein DL762_007426 [Monosporascus cannonballus]|uniref:Centrosomin N-terminal motif 1 domain-containing protein n=1 Tax=Monosporascus cannonballus TaxID=155416 RepID=A0ABY0GZ90_9PEZI|nr:hypothetical protein DL762_007426 [Monosporascus cannonballus]